VPVAQAGAGVEFEITDGLGLNAGYTAMLAPTTRSNIEQDAILIHTIQVGLNYRF
jgi:opacity protein-like surface antigen